MRPAHANLKDCACGGKRRAGKSACFACWQSAPPDLRAQCHAARTVAETTSAMSALRTHAASRNPHQSLF